MATRAQRDQARARRAQQEARLVYGPQISQLQGMIEGLRADAMAGSRAARKAGRALQANYQSSIPRLQSMYDESLRRHDESFNQNRADLAALNPGDRARLEASHRYLRDQLAADRAHSISTVQRRAQDARMQGIQQHRAILSDFKQDRAKAARQLLGMLGQQGAYVGKRVSDLTDADAARAFERLQFRTGQQNTLRDDRREDRKLRLQREKAGRRSARAGGGGNLESPAGHRQGRQGFGSAKASAAMLKRDFGFSRAEAAEAIMSGLNVKAGDERVEIKQVGDEAVVSAALDMAYMGYLHPHTVQKLRQAGYSLRGLNLAGKRKPRQPGVKIHQRPNAKPPKKAPPSPSMPHARY